MHCKSWEHFSRSLLRDQYHTDKWDNHKYRRTFTHYTFLHAASTMYKALILQCLYTLDSSFWILCCAVCLLYTVLCTRFLIHPTLEMKLWGVSPLQTRFALFLVLFIVLYVLSPRHFHPLSFTATNLHYLSFLHTLIYHLPSEMERKNERKIDG